MGFLMGCPLRSLAVEQSPESEYKERVAKTDPDKNPAAHKALAEWCKRKYPAKYEFHLEAWNLAEFGRSEKLLPAAPSLIELQRISGLAAKMGLEEKAQHYHGRWGEAQFTVFAKKLAPGNAAMMKKLLDWAVKEKVEFIAPCQELARNIITVEPEYVPARQALKHLKLAKGWMSWEEALASIDLQHAPDRLELHRLAAAQRVRKETAQYPLDPTRSMQLMRENTYRTATKNRAMTYFVWTRDYKRSQPCPLVISLHGGGEGGLEQSLKDAPTEAAFWQQNVTQGSWVMICPTAPKHVPNSWWNKDNLEDIFDMIEETADQFNIDRKRIYITGASMGANGAGQWVWVFPELAAASCARSGAYWTNWINIRDILSKPILVIHGEKDEPARNSSRDEYIKKTEGYGGKITHVSYPDQDHFLKSSSVYPIMIPFFLKHTNDIEPDFRLLREVFRDRHKKYPPTE